MVEGELKYAVPITLDLDINGFTRKISVMYQWCKTNSNKKFKMNVTIDQVAITANFSFESDADAALFKIFWS